MLADFERMFDARLKPVLKAIADDLIRVVGYFDDDPKKDREKSEMLCPHGNGLTDYYEPCGRVNGGES